jgi:hypothetical protein
MSNIATITPTVQVMLDAKVKADLLAGRIAATDWDAQFSQYLAEYAAQIEANLGFFEGQPYVEPSAPRRRHRRQASHGQCDHSADARSQERQVSQVGGAIPPLFLLTSRATYRICSFDRFTYTAISLIPNPNESD